MATHFAPAGRDAPEEFCRKVAAVRQAPLLSEVLNAMPSMVMVLNMNRQIVAANDALLSLLHVGIGHVMERRPGEALGCLRAHDGPDGCGTSRHCATCGAVNAILECQRSDQKVVRECRVLVRTPSGVGSMDLRVTVSPFGVGDDRFLTAAVEDISQSKRLAVLQRAFFHDVLNTAGCIQGYLQYLTTSQSSGLITPGELLQLANQLIEDIQAQRDLVYAESGELATQVLPVRTPHVIEEVRFQYLKHAVAEGREIVIAEVWDGTVPTDRRLLLRVLGNMVKNALEATSPGRAVSVSCFDRDSHVSFAIHNPEAMPEQVQQQVFQRSFSTKEQHGRGIGTYSMKLLGERYLGGRVEFSSSSQDGTTFTLSIPKSRPAKP
jgi:hypothetical protein